MTPPSVSLPRSLRIVARLEIVFGVLAALEVLSALFARRLSLNFGIAGLWIGPGLLQLRESAREWCVRLNLIGIGLAIVVSVLFAIGAPELPITVFGKPAGTISHWWAFVGVLALAAIGAWQVSVLERQDIRALFMRPGEEA